MLPKDYTVLSTLLYTLEILISEIKTVFEAAIYIYDFALMILISDIQTIVEALTYIYGFHFIH